jgi:hypothetical protein
MRTMQFIEACSIISKSEFSTAPIESSSIFSAISFLIRFAHIIASLNAKEAISLVPIK